MSSDSGNKFPAFSSNGVWSFVTRTAVGWQLAVGWQDELDNAPGLVATLALFEAGNVLAMSPMLYVQLRLGDVTFPALVDSGASDNFIDSDLVLSLQLAPLSLAVPTKIRQRTCT